jgi:radical SAM protein with 4Fe4S-binding SPASM domain
VTRACALACVHCRADAQPRRHPRELTTAEAFDVVDQVVEVGRPILVVTGGDPLMREDLFDILARANERGLRVAFSPSATGRCTRQALARARDCGVSRIHISLDGPDPESHDGFRGVRGSFQRTLEILEDVRSLAIPLQVGTTVSRHSIQRLPEIAEIVRAHSAVMWSLLFLVPTGRGRLADMVSAEEHEQVFNWLYDLAGSAPFDVRTTAAMPYRRVVSDGFAFIDHLGNVCPSGFLQLAAGNVREQSLAEVYRESSLFQALRDRSRLTGKCGACEYRQVCGGSRARAYAVSGDYLASDPSCAYVPAGWTEPC